MPYKDAERRREQGNRATRKYRANLSPEKKELFREKHRKKQQTDEWRKYKAQWSKNRYDTDEEYRKKSIAKARQWSKSNREKQNEYRRKQYTPMKGREQSLRKYGLSHDRFADMFAEQTGKCGICRTSDVGRKGSTTLHIDHCHATGKIRGLLCNGCNNGLGRFKDDPNLLRKAIAYLKKHR